jgi:outer membrane biosynthesis protein TonB
MSAAVAEPYPPPEAVWPEPLPDGVGRPGLAFSAALHLALLALFVFGLPSLFRPPPPTEMPIAVQLVTMGPETRATHPNPRMPVPEAKPEAPLPGPPGPKPIPEPAPPKPMPPPSAATAPTPPAPTPEPKPAVTPAPPPPAQPKQAEAPPPPPPPPPEPKPAPPPPPPKPVVEAAAPKPALARPQPAARSATRAEAKKYNPGQFDALLKNLAAEDTSPTPDALPQATRVAAGRPSSQPHAPLGSQLSASEVDMIREQISRCWNIPAGARDAKNLVVEIRVSVLPDGTVQQATIVDQGRLSDPSYRAAAESARRAFFNPACRPLRLPPDKYEIWKDMVVDFSPKDVL